MQALLDFVKAIKELCSVGSYFLVLLQLIAELQLTLKLMHNKSQFFRILKGREGI